MTAALTFRAEDHTYWYGDQRVPSVTWILSSLGLTGYAPDSPPGEAALRGTAVHQAAELLEHDDLEWGSLDPRLTGYLEAYERFRMETAAEPCVLLEQPLGIWLDSAASRYCGTPDQARFLRLAGGRQLCLLDIKTGQACEWHWLQLAAYGHLVRDAIPVLPEGAKRLVRVALYLRENGSYSLVPRGIAEAVADDQCWTACLTVHQYRRRFPVWTTE